MKILTMGNSWEHIKYMDCYLFMPDAWEKLPPEYKEGKVFRGDNAKGELESDICSLGLVEEKDYYKVTNS